MRFPVLEPLPPPSWFDAGDSSSRAMVAVCRESTLSLSLAGSSCAGGRGCSCCLAHDRHCLAGKGTRADFLRTFCAPGGRAVQHTKTLPNEACHDARQQSFPTQECTQLSLWNTSLLPQLVATLHTPCSCIFRCLISFMSALRVV